MWGSSLIVDSLERYSVTFLRNFLEFRY